LVTFFQAATRGDAKAREQLSYELGGKQKQTNKQKQTKKIILNFFFSSVAFGSRLNYLQPPAFARIALLALPGFVCCWAKKNLKHVFKFFSAKIQIRKTTKRIRSGNRVFDGLQAVSDKTIARFFVSIITICLFSFLICFFV
jgi:hypothetical protein